MWSPQLHIAIAGNSFTRRQFYNYYEKRFLQFHSPDQRGRRSSEGVERRIGSNGSRVESGLRWDGTTRKRTSEHRTLIRGKIYSLNPNNTQWARKRIHCFWGNWQLNCVKHRATRRLGYRRANKANRTRALCYIRSSPGDLLLHLSLIHYSGQIHQFSISFFCKK